MYLDDWVLTLDSRAEAQLLNLDDEVAGLEVSGHLEVKLEL